MAIWGAVVTGVVAAGTSYYNSKQQKKQAQAAKDNYDARVEFEREKLAQRRNSMGARMAPYLMDQMLRVYGEQTKGRGGFNLPIDEILANMKIDQRKAGTFSYDNQGYQPNWAPESRVRMRAEDGGIQEYDLPQRRAKVLMDEFDSTASAPQHEMLRDSLIGSRGNLDPWGTPESFDLPDRTFTPMKDSLPDFSRLFNWRRTRSAPLEQVQSGWINNSINNTLGPY